MIRATFTTRPTRALCFDCESRPSAFWFGDKTTAEITAFGWKWSDEPGVHTLLLQADGRFRFDGQRRALSAVQAYLLFRGELLGSDLAYGHNVRRFDLPLIQAGLMRLQLPPLTPVRTTDTLRDYPRVNDMSRSLENLAKIHLSENQEDVPGGREKLHLAIVDWEHANRLTPDGVTQARDRVVSDVLLQERLRHRLLELGLLKEPRMWKP